MFSSLHTGNSHTLFTMQINSVAFGVLIEIKVVRHTDWEEIYVYQLR